MNYTKRNTIKKRRKINRTLKKCVYGGKNHIKPPYILSKNKNIMRTKNKFYLKEAAVQKNWDLLKNTINQLYNKEDSNLPIGTALYRSSMEKDIMEFFSKDKDMVFFGLDYIISLWYGLEMWQRFRKNRYDLGNYNKWFVYLHEYEIIQPIEYKYISDIYTHPKFNIPDICTKEPCVHPQEILHGLYGVLKELGTELTLPYTFNFTQFIKPIKTYKINIIKLMEYLDKPIQYLPNNTLEVLHEY